MMAVNGTRRDGLCLLGLLALRGGLPRARGGPAI
jgi:hypothetical protein